MAQCGWVHTREMQSTLRMEQRAHRLLTRLRLSCMGTPGMEQRGIGTDMAGEAVRWRLGANHGAEVPWKLLL